MKDLASREGCKRLAMTLMEVTPDADAWKYAPMF